MLCDNFVSFTASLMVHSLSPFLYVCDVISNRKEDGTLQYKHGINTHIYINIAFCCFLCKEGWMFSLDRSLVGILRRPARSNHHP